MKNLTISNEDIELIRKFEELKKKGYYADGSQVTQVYNRIFNLNLSSTSCGSCIRQRIQQMVDALNNFEKLCKKDEENVETNEVDNNATGKKKTSQKQNKRVKKE